MAMSCVDFSADAMISLLQVYAPQTKILEGRTKDWMCLFQALSKGVGAIFGRQTIEKCFEKTVQTFCSAFQNLRLGSIKFARLLALIAKNMHAMQIAL